MSLQPGRGFAAIGLYAPKHGANVGGAMRAAYCFGASIIIVQGPRYKHTPADTPKTWRHIPVVQSLDLLTNVPHGCIPVAVELLPDARWLPQVVHPERAFYIFGPEDGNLPARIASRCPIKIQIPSVACLNLAATVNVVLYDRIAKQMENRHGSHSLQLRLKGVSDAWKHTGAQNPAPKLQSDSGLWGACIPDLELPAMVEPAEVGTVI